jgi:hypothetical protein
MGLSTYRLSRSLAIHVLFALTVALAAGTLAVVASSDSSNLYADGAGSTPACDDGPNVDGSIGPPAVGTGDEISHTVSGGNVVTGVCIKTGGGAEGHSLPLGNGSFSGTFGPDGCYVVSGVGTPTVTVTRIGTGSDCQELSHIDVLFGPPQPNGTTPTTTPPKQVTPPAPQAAPPRIVVGAAPFTG